MKQREVIFACFIWAVMGLNVAYKPVIFMHGIFADYDEAIEMLNWIRKDHPGTQILSVDSYNNYESVVNLVDQRHDIAGIMKNFMDQHPDGVNMICFSQGGLICRGVLELVEHNVDTFISLSSPQGGQFGDTDYLRYMFPKLIRDHVYKVAYTPLGQNVSFLNYWNDPHHQGLYRKHNKYLAVINNDTHNPHSHKYKENFMRLKKLVLIGGPDDGVIDPWQSSHFGFYNKRLRVVPYTGQKWYKYDSFGLRTLDERASIVQYTVPDVKHTHWYSNFTVYKNCVLPNLN